MNPVVQVLGSLMACAYVKINGKIDFPLKRADKLFFICRSFVTNNRNNKS